MGITKGHINIEDYFYPKLLKEIFDPPEKLYFEGQTDVLNKPMVAIVGTRKYSDYGEMMTEQIIEELSVLDIAVVSGMAKGIDTIAHKSALKNGLKTVAVLGSGLSMIYPKENIQLSKEISQNGIILSEYEPNSQPQKMNFPQRNRIVSGLSIATIIIEAPEKSGALITANFALEHGRDIFAVPGDVDRNNSIGCIKLIQSGGAYPILSGKDIIQFLKQQTPLFKIKENEKSKMLNYIPKNKNIISPEYNLEVPEKKILNLFPKRRAMTIEQIIAKAKMPMAQILTSLSILEINGLISTRDGKYILT